MPDTEPETITPARFIRELWGTAPPNWIVEFDLLQYRPTTDKPDDKRMRAMFYTVEQVLADWPTISRHLDKQNRSQVENIHHSVNPRFRKPRHHGLNTDVEAYVALWVDVDFEGNETAIRKQFGEVVSDLRTRGLFPSCVLESGRGLHAYWLLDRPYPVAEARPACAGIMDFFKISDPVHDPRRVLRVPGFLNLKNPKDPKQCFVSEASWKRFPLSAFSEFRIEPTKSDHDKEIEEAERGKPRTISRDPKIEAIKGGVDEGGGPFGGRHQAAVALAGHYCCRRKLTKKAILYTMHEWNGLNKPPLPEEEIARVVEDIWTKEQVKRAEEDDEEKPSDDKPDRKGSDDGPPWFDDEGNFIPALLAAHLIAEHKFMATPIGRDGKGVHLYVYEQGAFRPHGFSFVRKEIVRLLGKDLRRNRMEETVELVTELTKRPYEETDLRAKELVNVRNGMLNWRTGELVPHDSKYLSLIQIPVDWKPSTSSEKLDRFLRGVLPDDAITLVEEYAGYMLIPDTSMTKCLVAVGEGGNGKSTFLGLLEFLLGKDNISYCSLHAITEDRFSAASMILGKLANFYDELESKALENTGAFKQIVGGNPIKAEEKNKAPFSFRPFCRMVFATNQMPRASDKSQAYFDRFLFVEFNRRFRDTNDEVKNYERVLASDPEVLPALLCRAVAGLRRLMDRGRFSPPTSSTSALEEYRRDCNSAYDFLRECCRIDDPNGWLAAQIVYQRYKLWSEDEGRKPMSFREFNRTVRTVPNVRDVRRGAGNGWLGLSWPDGRPPKVVADEVEEFGREETGAKEGRGNLDF